MSSGASERLGAYQCRLSIGCAMQAVIAASQPGECVGLYCAQLLDLTASDNALAELGVSASG